MSRGGYRKGSGRKKEYKEPVKKVLIGLPQSSLDELDEYAAERDLSRPKAIVDLLNQAHLSGWDYYYQLLDEVKELREELRKQ